MDNSELLQIDLDKILRSRMSPGTSRLVPRFATRMLERIICQQELNEILRVTHPAQGSEFSRRVLQHLQIKVEVSGLKELDPNRRYIFASNHPLGGLDGITLIAILGEIFPDERLCFLVNDLLMNVIPLQNIFMPINKYGAQGREAAARISQAYSSPDKQMIIFPAGLVSRRRKGGEIKDLEWRKTFVQKALRTDREIVPIHFIARNSNRFYSTAQWRTRLRIPVNIEQALLPSELVRSRGKTFRVCFGKPIPVSTLRDLIAQKGPQATATHIRDISYET